MKNLKNLGKTLNKVEQKEIFGGRLTFNGSNYGGGYGHSCSTNEDCSVSGHICNCGDCIDPSEPFFPC